MTQRTQLTGGIMHPPRTSDLNLSSIRGTNVNHFNVIERKAWEMLIERDQFYNNWLKRWEEMQEEVVTSYTEAGLPNKYLLQFNSTGELIAREMYEEE